MLNRKQLIMMVSAVIVLLLSVYFISEAKTETTKDLAQAQVVLTVSESKRLIAKAVAEMSIVKKALEEGMVIICKGTTTTYIAEEIIGEKIEPGAFVYGKTYPEKGGKKFNPKTVVPEVIIINGKIQKDLTLEAAVKKLKPNDVVIKGANALDYENKIAGGIIGAQNSGTVGKIIPYITGTRARLIIPVGLEKQVSGKPLEIAKKMLEIIEQIHGEPPFVK